jgi:hypothetical protein
MPSDVALIHTELTKSFEQWDKATLIATWRTKNPGEAAKFDAYRNGGARPTLVTPTGQALVHEMDAWYESATVVVPPDPPPVPGVGLLPVKPPGWNGGSLLKPASFPGYEVIRVGSLAEAALRLTDGKKYYIMVDLVANAPKTGGRVGVQLFGGGDCVIPIPRIHLTSQSTQGDPADPCSLIVDDGTPGAHVYAEGGSLHSVNGLTVRTKRKVTLQWTRIECVTFQGNHSDAHADPVQAWDRGPSPQVTLAYCSLRSDYTGISVLMPPNPPHWLVDHLDLRFVPGHTGPGIYFGDDEIADAWVINEAYFDAQDSDEGLADGLAGWGQNNMAYVATTKDGSRTFKSADPPPGGNPPPIGFSDGDYITYPKYQPRAKWTRGRPPGGEFVPEAATFMGYQEKGYKAA